MRLPSLSDRPEKCWAGVATKRYRKPTNTKVAPAAVMQTIAAEAQLAVIALSD